MERKNPFSIGEVSKLFHISVSSLRHYEKLLDYITKEQIQIVGFYVTLWHMRNSVWFCTRSE